MKHPSGFTLLEMAVVLVIAGLLVGTFLTMQRSLSQSQAANVTQARMEAIRKALVQYASLNGDLPCPASRTLANNAVNFGRELLPPGPPSTELGGHCNHDANIAGTTRVVGRDPDGNPATDNASATVPAISGRVRIGTVPVRTLGLPDEYIADGWGRRFHYAVSANLTQGPDSLNFSNGSIRVREANGGAEVTPIQGNAIYVVVSAGPDGKGAGETMTGTIPASRACNSAVGRDVSNCNHADAEFNYSMQRFLAQGPNHYDDYMIYAINIPELMNQKKSLNLLEKLTVAEVGVFSDLSGGLGVACGT